MHLAATPVRSIVRAVADAASRWSDADFPARVRALDGVCERTGYSLPVVEYALDRLFFPLSEEALAETIAAELGSLDVLDRFVERGGGAPARALGTGPACIVSSRTTIGVAIVPAIFALCAKCDVLVKDREDHLVAAFFATLGEELDALREAARAQTWSGAQTPAALEEFATVVAFGSDETLAGIRRALGPDVRFAGYGSKASAGYVARGALEDAATARTIAAGAARDLVLYDTEGCLSLHALFVEDGAAVTPAEFAGMLARAVERAAVEFPPGQRRERAAAVASARDLAAFRAAAGRGAVYADAAATYCIVYDPPAEEPPLFLPRAVAVRPVAEPAQAATYLREQRLPIEAVAVAGARADVKDMALASGASRIASFGTLQAPPLQGFHGGRPRIAHFVRWIADET